MESLPQLQPRLISPKRVESVSARSLEAGAQSRKRGTGEAEGHGHVRPGQH